MAPVVEVGHNRSPCTGGTERGVEEEKGEGGGETERSVERHV